MELYQSMESLDRYAEQLQDIRTQLDRTDLDNSRRYLDSSVREGLSGESNYRNVPTRNSNLDFTEGIEHVDKGNVTDRRPIRKKQILRKSTYNGDESVEISPQMDRVLPSSQQLEAMIEEIDDATRTILKKQACPKVSFRNE